MEQLKQLFDFFIPRFCISCNTKLLSNETYLCNICFNEIHTPSLQRLKTEFSRKFEKDGIISGFVSAYIFEKDQPLQHLIHSLKYEENFRIGIYLGKKVAEIVKPTILNWGIDYLVPVPLHNLKKAERGYNQSYFIAKGISQILKTKINHKILKRKRYTNTQTELTLMERKNNIKDAFEVKNKKLIRNKIILLVDDVITTGATISECARTLINQGASKVFALSVAIADYRDTPPKA